MSSFVAGAALLVAWMMAAPSEFARAQSKAQSKAGPQAQTKSKAAPEAPKGPAPHLASGRVDFNGLWRPADIFLIEDISLGLKEGEKVPVNATAEEIMKKHLSRDDPEANCLPTGVPRHAPYPWKIVESPPYIYFLFEGNIHSYRQIFMDGRKHPADVNPTWYGHSTGTWDKDTLVIDTVGFNDLFWFDFVGHPHSEQLHTIERYSRPDLGTLREEVTIEDPAFYTRPFTINASHRLLLNDELMEYICQENQKDTVHLVGPAGRP